MAASKPVILLLHGIWHSPLTYTKLTSALQTRGYEVHIPWLPTCTGARPPTGSFSEDIQLVRRFVEMLVDQGREIIVLMHSYGGVIGCCALEGLDHSSRAREGKAGGVKALMGLAAHIHPKGSSVIDIVHEMGHKDLIPVAFDVSSDGSCFSGNARLTLFNGIPDTEADELLKTLSRAPFSTMEAKVQGEAWRTIPLTYIYTTEDLTLPRTYQDRILEKMRDQAHSLRVVEMETGHSPFITKTEEVVKVIEDVVAEQPN